MKTVKSAKPSKTLSIIRAYTGNASYGVDVRVAETASGWFFSTTQRTRWGSAWTKWAPLQEEPTFNTAMTNVYSGEVTHTETPYMEWGFNRLFLTTNAGWRIKNV